MSLSKWSSYDSQIFALLPEYRNRSVELAKHLLNATEGRRGNADVDSLSGYIRKSPKFQSDVSGIEQACNNVGVDPSHAPMLWLKTKGESVRIDNPLYVPARVKEIIDIDFEALFKDIKPVPVTNITYNCDGLFDRLVYTDVHIGMDVNKDGFALYPGNWDESEINSRLEIMVNKVIACKKSNTLYIDDLGDFLDGYDGETVRRGHHLPQNMDNQKAFEVGFAFKVRMIDTLIHHYSKIVCHNITDDNHAGSFAGIVNSAFKTYIELKYPGNVEVVIQRRFIDHYQVGNNIFVLSHGKDGKNLKFGMKPVLDPKTEKNIKKYIEEHWLLQKGVKIEFSKGDSHQYIFDNSTGSNFSYYNYPAFSPPSNWVKTNFGNSPSGFVFFNYSIDGQRTVNDHIF